MSRLSSGVKGAAATLTLCFFAALAAPARAQAPPAPNANQWGINMIGAPTAWALGYSGAGVTVAVGDSQIDTAHPAFAGKIDPRSMNFVLTGPGAAYNPTSFANPDSHGTHVAGIIAASAASGVPGVAYGANLVGLTALDACAKGQNCGAPDIPNASASALNYFAGLNGVMLYNASYGPTVGKNLTAWPATTIDPVEENAALGAIATGKILVAANGNDRDTNPVAGSNPNGLALDPFIQPANANAGVYQDGGNNYDFSALQRQAGLIVAVTAVGQDKLLAYYAQACGVTASWCVAAPGGNQISDAGIYSTLPGAAYGYLQGTSMATPMATGALAALQGAYPGYIARDLANVLFATAENIGGQPADNATYGYGLIRLDRATAGPTALAAGVNVFVPAQTTAYWSQPLTTAGGFNVVGPGYLVVAGRTTSAGDVGVTGGALGVDGTLTLQTRMTIGQGGMLTGFGTVVGAVTVGGVLNAGQLPNYGDLAANNGGALPAGVPLTGTSPGTLTFQGSVTLTGTATTRDNIDGALQIPGGPGTFDKIVITGPGATFAANGALTPLMRGIPGGNNNYVPAIGAMFPFVTAVNGAAIAGQFTSIAQPAGLPANGRLDVVYLPTSITLNVTPLTFQGLAANQNLNPNAQGVAGVLDQIRPQPGVTAKVAHGPTGAAETAVLDALYDDGGVQADDAALASLSGQGHAALPGAIMTAYSAFADAMFDRQDMLLTEGAQAQGALSPGLVLSYADAGPGAKAGLAGDPFGDVRAAAVGPYGQWTTWGHAYDRWSSVGSAGGLPGAASRGAGLVAGADRFFSNDLVAGAAVGYSRTSTTSAGVSGATDVWAGGLYATWAPGGFVFEGRLAGGATTTPLSRAITFPGEAVTATSKANGWGGLVAGEAGYRFVLPGLTVKPYVGLADQVLRQDAFSESTDFGLSFPAQTYVKTTTAVGALATTTYRLGAVTLMPQAKLAWTHDLRDDTLTTEAALFDAPFSIGGANPGRDAAVVGLKLAAWRAESLDVFAGYAGEFRSNAVSQQVFGGLRVFW